MQYVLIIHEVENYPAWKAVFDRAAGIRKDAGERTFQVLRFENEPNKIVHFSAWTSTAAAKAFFESPELVKIREEAGVKTPEFLYLEEIETGRLQ
jgi:quinol monooxygenase YgiN